MLTVRCTDYFGYDVIALSIGHPYADPVHFYNYVHYYDEAARILRAAIHAQCPLMPTRAIGMPRTTPPPQQ